MKLEQLDKSTVRHYKDEIFSHIFNSIQDFETTESRHLKIIGKASSIDVNQFIDTMLLVSTEIKMSLSKVQAEQNIIEYISERSGDDHEQQNER